MDQQTTIITIALIGLAIFLIMKIVNMIKRGFYKIASIYIALTASSGGGLTYMINHLSQQG